MRLLKGDFRYVPSTQTNVAATWQRFGFRPTSESERRARQQGFLRHQGHAHDKAPDGAARASAERAVGVAVPPKVSKLRNTVSKFAVSQKFRSQ
jgi:hypothetical protein